MVHASHGDVATYETADDNFALASRRDSCNNGCDSLGSSKSPGLLRDSAGRCGGGCGGFSSGSATGSATATGAGRLGVLHDLVERLVEFSLSRHCEGCDDD
jgi:hypothetical protein